MDRRNVQNVLLHELFEIVILLKGAFGVIEIFVGFFILLVNRAAVSDVLLYLVHGELLEDPTSLFAGYIANLSQNLSANTELFIGGYFLIYGLIKIFLVVGLLRGKIWSYRAAIGLPLRFYRVHVLPFQLHAFPFSRSSYRDRYSHLGAHLARISLHANKNVCGMTLLPYFARANFSHKHISGVFCTLYYVPHTFPIFHNSYTTSFRSTTTFHPFNFA